MSEKNKKDTQCYTAHYANGNVRWMMTVKNGLADGVFLGYYENGVKRFRCSYVAGKRQGEYWQFSEDGSVEEKGIYKDDVKTQVWRKDGLSDTKKSSQSQEKDLWESYKAGVTVKRSGFVSPAKGRER